MQPDPRLLGLPFKRGPKLLSLVFNQTHLNLDKFIVIIITHFWIILKFISFFFKNKKKPKQCRFKPHYSRSSPIFLKSSFPLTLSPDLTPHIPTIPCQHDKEKRGNHALGRLCKSRPTPPYPALGQGRVALSPASYKYRGRTRNRGGARFRRKTQRRG